MAMPSFSEYMKNKSDIITVQLFPHALEQELEKSELTQLITMAKNEASKCHCTIAVFDKQFAYTNMNNKTMMDVLPDKGFSIGCGIFVTGSEKQLKKMFGGKKTISTKSGKEIEVFAMNGSSFDKKFIVKGKIYS